MTLGEHNMIIIIKYTADMYLYTRMQNWIVSRCGRKLVDSAAETVQPVAE